MIKIAHLWERLVSWENLIEAAFKAGRGKRFRPDVAAFNARIEEELFRLRDKLTSGAYRPGPYRTFRVRDGKERIISAAPYRDRVVHHALCNVIEPIWEQRFIHDSYACRPGKGTHAAADRYQEFSRRGRFVLQCDISKYFPSIDHEILMGEIHRVVADRDVLRLVGCILGTHGDAGLLWPAGKGLPLGNQTSQFFGNVYLDRFDHWIKEDRHRRFYLRYVDDFVIVGDSAIELQKLLKEIREYLVTLGLAIHPRKCRVFPVSEGCDFVGYRIWPTHRRLRRHSGYRFRRRFRAMRKAMARGAITAEEIRPHVMSWIGHARHADTWRLRQSILLS
jgi:retron-type reverse transcriptase